MAKTKLVLDKNEFQRIVNEVESKETFSTTTSLWEFVCQTDWAKGLLPRPLTPQVAYLRAKELGIVTKTQPGKRGSALKGGPGVAVRKRTPRKEKLKAFADSFISQRQQMPTRFHHLIEKAEAGSVKASIALKCIDCCAFQPIEVKHCGITSCPLYPHRPFQKKDDLQTTITAINDEDGDTPNEEEFEDIVDEAA